MLSHSPIPETALSAPVDGATTPCRLCGTDRVRKLFEKQAIPYFRCLKCDFVFSRPSTNANLANQFDDFEPAYLQYLADSVEDERNHTAVLRWIEKFCSLDGRRVLDVGCGSGKFVRFLRKANIEAFGLEGSQPLYSRFLAESPFFISQTVEEYAATADAEQFGAIFACDVIEHLERPDHFLRDAAGLLQPGGTLFVSTPDVGSLTSRLCGRRWHFYNRYHLSYLSRQTIAAMAECHGLREVRFGHLPRLKSVGYILQYFSNFVLGSGRARIPDRLNQFAIPLNLFDTMSIAFQKDPS